MLDTQHLHTWQALLANNPYIYIKKQPTFLSIAGFPERETVISNLYAHFLDVEKVGVFAYVFLDKFLKAAGLTRGFMGARYKVYREYYTLSGKYVDIACMGDRGVLLIENKVFHSVGDHQLTGYVPDVEKETELPTSIIILGLHKMAELNEYMHIPFISHKEALALAEDMIGTLREPDMTFFKDFKTHMEQEFYTQIDEDTLRYVLQNGPEIARLHEAEKQAKVQILKWCENAISNDFFIIYSRQYKSSNHIVLETKLRGVWAYLSAEQLLTNCALKINLHVLNKPLANKLNELDWERPVHSFAGLNSLELAEDDITPADPFAWSNIPVNLDMPDDIVARLEQHLSTIIMPFVELLGEHYPFLREAS